MQVLVLVTPGQRSCPGVWRAAAQRAPPRLPSRTPHFTCTSSISSFFNIIFSYLFNIIFLQYHLSYLSSISSLFSFSFCSFLFPNCLSSISSFLFVVFFCSFSFSLPYLSVRAARLCSFSLHWVHCGRGRPRTFHSAVVGANSVRFCFSIASHYVVDMSWLGRNPWGGTVPLRLSPLTSPSQVPQLPGPNSCCGYVDSWRNVEVGGGRQKKLCKQNTFCFH